MWTTEIELKTKAKKEQIWELWTDINNWKNWDQEIEKSEIFGEFKVGTKGILKPLGTPTTKFEIISCEKYKSFSDRSFLPFCKMDFIHTINENAQGLQITHRVEMSGAFTFIFSKIIGSKIKEGLPKAVASLIQLAEKVKVK